VFATPGLFKKITVEVAKIHYDDSQGDSPEKIMKSKSLLTFCGDPGHRLTAHFWKASIELKMKRKQSD
jgi:hypothetical protein